MIAIFFLFFIMLCAQISFVAAFLGIGPQVRHEFALIRMSEPSNDAWKLKQEVNGVMRSLGLLGITSFYPSVANAYGAIDVPKKKKSGKVKVLETSLGIKYIDLKEGEGPNPSIGDYSVINYLGFLANGTEFDSTYSKKNLSFKYGAKQVIPGIEDVLETMRPGGQRSCTIPGISLYQLIFMNYLLSICVLYLAKYAYGSKGICLNTGECLVQPNEDLKYVITLKRVAASYN